YALAFWDLTTAMWAGLAALFLRQIGHAILEPPCHDKEALLLGFNTRNKTLILGAYLLIPVVHLLSASAWTVEAMRASGVAVVGVWFLRPLFGVGARWAALVGPQVPRPAMVGFWSLITDPTTDVGPCSPRSLRREKGSAPFGPATPRLSTGMKSP